MSLTKETPPPPPSLPFEVVATIQEKYDAVFALVDDVVCTLDPAGHIKTVNGAFERALGWAGDEWVGRSFVSLLHAEHQALANAMLARVLAGEAIGPFRITARKKDGGVCHIESHVRPLRCDGVVEGMVVVARDRTALLDQIRVTEELRLTKERLETAQRAAEVVSWELDFTSGNVFWSENVTTLYGLDCRQLSAEDWYRTVHPEDRERTRLAVEHAVASGDTVNLEFRVVWPDGSIRWLLSKGRLFRDAEGKPVRLVGVNTEITQRKRHEEQLERWQLELRARTEQLARSNAELEQFAYVASHDLKEPLRSVSSFLQLLALRYGGALDDTAKSYIRFAIDGSKRMYALINDLLDYSKVGREGQPFERTDLTEIFERVLHNCHAQIQESEAEIQCEKLPEVLAVPAQMIQLFGNLLGNAIKYRHPERKPLIRLSVQEVDGEWRFALSDNGIGIGRPYWERIFVMFQRLHGRGEYSGTGIGLAVCKRVLEFHRGRIWVESIPREGSTFFFTLPKVISDIGGAS